jgi:CYTH domain-containing protein
MPLEIERRFLVDGDGWRAGVRRRESYRAGRVAGSAPCSVRARAGGGRKWHAAGSVAK